MARLRHQECVAGLRPAGRALLFATIVACLTVYFVVVVFTFSQSTLESWPKVSVDDQERMDPFALHPEQHISRSPRTIKLQWTITRKAQRPDGVLKNVHLINDQFPGPTIEARAGDELEVTVTNSIVHDTEGVAIHWHGMTMKGSNEMDGVVGITQCTIRPGHRFVYKFKIQQHGTFWYHAHSAVKRADGLYGGLVVHRPAEGHESDSTVHGYDSEKLLLIGDWYHRPAEKVLAEYKDFRNSANEPAPDSLLINGLGSYNCSNARPGRPVDCAETAVPVVKVSGTVRLRIINVGAAAGYSIQLERATMLLLTVDGGGLVSKQTPPTSTIGVLYPGERIDVVTMPESMAHAVLKIALDPELMQLMNPALTRMQTFSVAWEPAAGDRNVMPSHQRVHVFDLKNARGRMPPHAVGAKPAETALLYTRIGISSFKNDEPWGELNHTSWVWKDPDARPLLAINRDAWANGTEQANRLRTLRVPSFEAGDRWMDLVVNNVDDRGHPFHLHGYEFYVVASHRDELGRAYNPFVDSLDASLVTDAPLRKDTVYIPSRGYVILRFRLDNPGLWLMHCHVLWHQAVGMGTVLQIGNMAQATAQKAGQSCRR